MPEPPEHPQSAAVVVAHPDDETLWAGGFLLAHPDWRWTVVTLCRGSDPDRAPRFRRVLGRLGAQGAMADLDDGPEQVPLPSALVQETVLSLLPSTPFDLILTHGPAGEYTRHRRHEETCRAVATLWHAGALSTAALWMFAYEDGGRRYLPRPAPTADVREALPEACWQEKYEIITQLYGFPPDSWEARTTPRLEAFRCFSDPRAAGVWIQQAEHRP